MIVYAVFGDEVCVVKCVKLNRQDRDGEVFRVQVLPSNGIGPLLDKKSVCISGSFLSSAVKDENGEVGRPLSEEEKHLYAIRASRKLQYDTDNMITVSEDNFEDLIQKKANSEIVGTEVQNIFFKILQKHPGLDVSERVPFVSTYYTRSEIQRSISYMIETGILTNGRSQDNAGGGFKKLPTYRISGEGFRQLTTAKHRITGEARDNQYFKVVDIPKLRGKDFAFVIMPIKKNEENEKIYREIVKPTVAERTGLECIRADDINSAGKIDDQVYTCIERCKLLIAELSVPNRNVDMELGMAIRANRQICILTRNKLDSSFFDVRNFRQIIYKDEDDLKQQLEGFEFATS